LGEACHFVDLLRFLAGSPIVSVRCLSRDFDGQDGGCFELAFANGDAAALHYRTDLPAHLPKERIAVAGDGWSAEVDNWRSLRSTNLPGASARPAWLGGPARGKGHREALSARRDRRSLPLEHPDAGHEGVAQLIHSTDQSRLQPLGPSRPLSFSFA
jgi:predicted dehydrogenase